MSDDLTARIGELERERNETVTLGHKCMNRVEAAEARAERLQDAILQAVAHFNHDGDAAGMAVLRAAINDTKPEATP